LKALQDYFLGRELRPQNYPEHIGIRFTQEDIQRNATASEDERRMGRSFVESVKGLLKSFLQSIGMLLVFVLWKKIITSS
jgi:hypothetical protein